MKVVTSHDSHPIALISPSPPLPFPRRLSPFYITSPLPLNSPHSSFSTKLIFFRPNTKTITKASNFVTPKRSPELRVAVENLRNWNLQEVATAGVMGFLHLICVFAPFCFSWAAFWVAFGLYFATGMLGITLSFHRNLSHGSFKVPKWLEYFIAYCGVHALQGNPIDWVNTHRYHHQFSDTERDPHSPIDGFWFSHMNWLFDTNTITQKCGEPNNIGDLEKQPFYRIMKSSYILHPIGLAFVLYALGGFPFIVWGMGVRIVLVYHITWFVNSACHIWGTQEWNTGNLSRNNWWVALLAFGEGWHNNHHAFEYSARHGLKWWQIDMTWYIVRFLQAIGLATNVKIPSESHKQRMAIDR